jgi:ribosomal-protein-alanine N-acetyltransferase
MAVHFVLDRLGALDLDRAANLHAEAFGPLGERPWTRRDLAELLASRGVSGLLLRADDVDAGFALWRVVADEAELLTIAVRAIHRRQGAGRRLLLATIDEARAAGARSLYLEVGIDNPPACTLYSSLGFQAVGRRPAYYRRGPGAAVDGVVMRLTLN